MMKYEINKSGSIYYARVPYHDIMRALRDKSMTFPEVFEDYEVASIGKLLRANLVEDWIQKDTSLLDVGIGDGIVAKYLTRKLNIKVHGLDISENSCKKAKERGIDWEVKDVNYGLKLNPNEIYDYRLLMEVIEHRSNRRK